MDSTGMKPLFIHLRSTGATRPSPLIGTAPSTKSPPPSNPPSIPNQLWNVASLPQVKFQSRPIRILEPNKFLPAISINLNPAIPKLRSIQFRLNPAQLLSLPHSKGQMIQPDLLFVGRCRCVAVHAVKRSLSHPPRTQCSRSPSRSVAPKTQNKTFPSSQRPSLEIPNDPQIGVCSRHPPVSRQAFTQLVPNKKTWRRIPLFRRQVQALQLTWPKMPWPFIRAL